MKKRIAIVFAIALMIGAVVSSCKKYEEDYGLMLKSPKGRLVGKWNVSQLDSDTMSIKMSDYSMFGNLCVTFEKDGTGVVEFEDNGLGEFLEGVDWEELLSELGDEYDVDTTGMGVGDVSDEIGDIDFASLLSEKTKFKWEFNDDKTYLKFSAYDETTSSYAEAIEMKILSLCKSDMKLQFTDSGETFSVSMQKADK